MSPDYIPSQYWQDIHDAGGDESTVGYPNLARSINRADYGRVLNDTGLTIVDIRPVSCLLVNVIDTRREISFRLMERYWEWLSRLVGRRERVGRLVGPVLRAADLVATRIVSPGPSAKIIVARADRSLTSCVE